MVLSTELPSKPVIFDEYGKEITGVAGPYNEGGDFKLICSVNGGKSKFSWRWPLCTVAAKYSP